MSHGLCEQTLISGSTNTTIMSTKLHLVGLLLSTSAVSLQAPLRSAHEPTQFFLDEPSGRYRVGDTVRLRFEVGSGLGQNRVKPRWSRVLNAATSLSDGVHVAESSAGVQNLCMCWQL